MREQPGLRDSGVNCTCQRLVLVPTFLWCMSLTLRHEPPSSWRPFRSACELVFFSFLPVYSALIRKDSPAIVECSLNLFRSIVQHAQSRAMKYDVCVGVSR